MSDKDDNIDDSDGSATDQDFGDEETGEDDIGLGALKMSGEEEEEDDDDATPWVNQLDQEEPPAEDLRPLNYEEGEDLDSNRLPEDPGGEPEGQQAAGADEDEPLNPDEMPSPARPEGGEPEKAGEEEPDDEDDADDDDPQDEGVDPFPDIDKAEPPARRQSFDSAYEQAAGDKKDGDDEDDGAEQGDGGEADTGAFGGDDGVGDDSNITPFPQAAGNEKGDEEQNGEEARDEYNEDAYDAPSSAIRRMPGLGRIGGMGRMLAGAISRDSAVRIGGAVVGAGVLAFLVWLVIDSFPGAGQPTAEDEIASRFAVPQRTRAAAEAQGGLSGGAAAVDRGGAIRSNGNGPTNDGMYFAPAADDETEPAPFAVQPEAPGGPDGTAETAYASAPAVKAAVPEMAGGQSAAAAMNDAGFEERLAASMAAAMSQAVSSNGGANGQTVRELQTLRNEIRALTGRIASLENEARRLAREQTAQLAVEAAAARDRESFAGTVGSSRGERDLCSVDDQLFLSALGQPLQAGVYGDAAGRRWVRMVSPIWQHSLRPGDALPSGERDAEVQLDNRGVYVLVRREEESECIIPIGGTAG